MLTFFVLLAIWPDTGKWGPVATYTTERSCEVKAKEIREYIPKMKIKTECIRVVTRIPYGD
jgi:hypothetical protein